MLGIKSRIDSEFKELFRLPKLFRLKSFYLSHFRPEMFLIFVIEVRNVFLVMSCVSVFVEDEFAQIVVFKNVFSVSSESVVEGDDALTNSVDKPFGLEHKFANNRHGMIEQLDVGWLNVIQSPHGIPSQIGIMFWPVINSAFSSGDDFTLFQILNGSDFFFGLFNFLDIASILFSIEIVWILIFLVVVVLRTKAEWGEVC